MEVAHEWDNLRTVLPAVLSGLRGALIRYAMIDVYMLEPVSYTHLTLPTMAVV